MTLKEDEKRLEELFMAEVLLQRVWLHIQNVEPMNLASLMLVTALHDSICDEAQRLKRSSRQKGRKR